MAFLARLVTPCLIAGITASLPAQDTPSPPALAISNGGRIALLDPTSGATTILVEDLVHDRPLTWSPDRRHLLYWRHSEIGWDVWCVERSGERARNLTHTTAGGCRMPAWSPDGRWIAFMRDQPNGLHVMNRDGGDARRLTTQGHRDQRPSWSPDGETLLVSWFEEDDGGTLVWHTERVTLEDGTSTPVTTQLDSVRDAAWSPVRDEVLVLGRRTGERDGLHLVAASDGAVRRLVPGENDGWFDRPTWHPAGTSFAFVAATRGGSEVRLHDLEAKATRVLLRAKRIHDLAWSPDGTQLAVVQETAEATFPTVFDLDAGTQRDFVSVPARQCAW